MIGAPAVVDAVRVTQEAADVSEAVRLLQGGADNQRILHHTIGFCFVVAAFQVCEQECHARAA